jgi:hypothetical protein
MPNKEKGQWRKRTQGTVNQIGQAFHLEPHGDRSKLPKSLQQVSFSEISDALAKRRRKDMTPEEIAEEEMIDQAIQEAIAEREQAEYQKNLLQKLGDAIDKRDKKNRLKKALEEAKVEQEEYETEIDEGYGEGWKKQVEKGKRLQDENEVFG